MDQKVHSHNNVQRRKRATSNFHFSAGPTWLWCAAALTIVLNLVDGLFTMAFVDAGFASEANPIMAVPLEWGTIEFMLVKLILVSLGIALLWQWRARSLARSSIVGMTAVYGMIVIHHFRLAAQIAGA